MPMIVASGEEQMYEARLTRHRLPVDASEMTTAWSEWRSAHELRSGTTSRGVSSTVTVSAGCLRCRAARYPSRLMKRDAHTPRRDWSRKGETPISQRQVRRPNGLPRQVPAGDADVGTFDNGVCTRHGPKRASGQAPTQPRRCLQKSPPTSNITTSALECRFRLETDITSRRMPRSGVRAVKRQPRCHPRTDGRTGSFSPQRVGHWSTSSRVSCHRFRGGTDDTSLRSDGRTCLSPSSHNAGALRSRAPRVARLASGAMRILLVSDLHYTLKQLDWVTAAAGDFDLVVVAGDHLNIASPVDPDAQIAVVLEYLSRMAARSTSSRVRATTT